MALDLASREEISELFECRKQLNQARARISEESLREVTSQFLNDVCDWSEKRIFDRLVELTSN